MSCVPSISCCQETTTSSLTCLVNNFMDRARYRIEMWDHKVVSIFPDALMEWWTFLNFGTKTNKAATLADVLPSRSVCSWEIDDECGEPTARREVGDVRPGFWLAFVRHSFGSSRLETMENGAQVRPVARDAEGLHGRPSAIDACRVQSRAVGSSFSPAL